MQITLKKLKHARSMSEETNAFTADVYADGVLIAYARNDGGGGCTCLSPIKGGCDKKLREAEKWALEQPPIVTSLPDPKAPGGYFSYACELDGMVDRLVEQDLMLSDWKKTCAKGVVVGVNEGQFTFYKYKPKSSDADKMSLLNRIKAKGETVYNDMPWNEVLAAMGRL